MEHVLSRIAASAALSLGLVAQASAFGLDANVGSDSVAANVNGGIGVGVGVASAGARYEAGGVFHSGSGSNYNEGYVGLGVTGDVGLRPAKLSASIGLRGAYLDGPDASGAAVPVVARLDLRLPPFDRLVWSVYGAYAPDALAFSDAHEYQMVGAQVGYELLRVATVYAGYRSIAVDFERNGVHTVDNGFHAGLSLDFF